MDDREKIEQILAGVERALAAGVIKTNLAKFAGKTRSAFGMMLSRMEEGKTVRPQSYAQLERYLSDQGHLAAGRNETGGALDYTEELLGVVARQLRAMLGVVDDRNRPILERIKELDRGLQQAKGTIEILENGLRVRKKH